MGWKRQYSKDVSSMINKFNAVHAKIPARFFENIGKIIFKFIAKTILKESRVYPI